MKYVMIVMKKKMTKPIELIKETILLMSDTEDMEEAIEYFENNRHKSSKFRTQEFFDELVLSQIAVLFKVLIDCGEVDVIDNVIKLKQKVIKNENREI